MFLWIFFSVVFLYFFYKYVIVQRFYWEKRGIPHERPLPIFGNFLSIMTKRQNFFDYQNEYYKKFPNDRYFGNFLLTSPAIFIRDPELIKQIGVKQFHHFMDHRPMSTSNDVLFHKNLIALKGNEWREMRAFLSPTFTSSKMKGMFDLISACANRVTQHFLRNDENTVEVELKDLLTRYANDVIGTCAFGVECDSLKEPNNEFYVAGQDVVNFSGLRGLKMLLANFAPEVMRWTNMEIFPRKFSDFFIGVIKSTIAHREENGIMRPDVIHLLLEARKGQLKHETKRDESDRGFAVVEESPLGKADVRIEGMSDIDIASQCFIFYIAGFDTASTVLSFALTELAIQPDIQETLFREIDDTMRAQNGELTYDAVMRMKYLDMVVSETLRLWPPAPALDRLCNKDFSIEAATPSENTVTVKAGEIVIIPIVGLHRDPQYFPDPDRFDPERFSDENKAKIVPYSYLPFGVGPRACIGNRFALLETKILLAQFLHKFEVHVVEKTCVPIVITKKALKIAPDNGFWVGLRRRVE